MPLVGAPVRRLEDARLLRGQAKFIEDLELPRQLHVAFVRSEYPHARLSRVRLAEARALDGMVAALSVFELGSRFIEPVIAHPALRPCAQPILADSTVRYV